MNENNKLFITGASGGIGTAICNNFKMYRMIQKILYNMLHYFCINLYLFEIVSFDTLEFL